MGTKFITFIIISMLISVSLFAQSGGINIESKRPLLYISAEIGPSIPLTDFASDYAYDNKSGYAELGYKVEVNGGINIGAGFSIGLMGLANYNPTNIDSYAKRLSDQNPGTSWTGESEQWQVYGGLGGFTFGYPVGKDLFLDLRALTGFIYAVSPEFSFSYNNAGTGTTDSYKVEKNESGAWSTLFSVKLSYQTSKHIMLTGGVDFLNSKPTFENVKTIMTMNNIQSESQTSFSRQIYALIVSAGIKYVFY